MLVVERQTPPIWYRSSEIKMKKKIVENCRKWNQEITFASRTSLVIWWFSGNSTAVDLPMFVAAITKKIAPHNRRKIKPFIYVVCAF